MSCGCNKFTHEDHTGLDLTAKAVITTEGIVVCDGELGCNVVMDEVAPGFFAARGSGVTREDLPSMAIGGLTAGGSTGKLCTPWKDGPVDPWTGSQSQSRTCCTPKVGKGGYALQVCAKITRPVD